MISSSTPIRLDSSVLLSGSSFSSSLSMSSPSGPMTFRTLVSQFGQTMYPLPPLYFRVQSSSHQCSLQSVHLKDMGLNVCGLV